MSDKPEREPEDEVEIIDDGDDLTDEAVIAGLRRAFDIADAELESIEDLIPEPEEVAPEAPVPPPVSSPDTEVKVTGRLRRVKVGVARHYGPGPHPGTGTEQQVHAGDGADAGAGAGEVEPDDRVRVGITSAREGVDPREVFDDMREFEGSLRELAGVKNVRVQPGLGGWEGGAEPTWVVEYQGDGEALRLLAQTGKKYNQDAILIMEDASKGGGSPIVDWHFTDPVTPGERDAVEGLLTSNGIGGWTWFRRPGGFSVLRAAAVPQWGGERQEHLERAERLGLLFEAAGMPFERSDSEARIQVLEREGENAYDTVLEEAA